MGSKPERGAVGDLVWKVCIVGSMRVGSDTSSIKHLVKHGDRCRYEM